MKNILKKSPSLLSPLGEFLKRKPKDRPVIDEPPTSPRGGQRTDRFAVVSWTVTLWIAAALIGAAVYYKSAPPLTYAPAPTPTAVSETGPSQVALPAIGAEGGGFSSILRKLQLKTNIPQRPRYEASTYRVSRGDALLRIAEQFNLKTETLLYVNTQLEDNPHNLKPGMELLIPPVDGLYYEWKEGDTFESVADKFDANPEDIINFPGNKIDLTNPAVEPGAKVMIPGGKRDLRDWTQDLQTAARGANTGTGGGNAANTCGGGPVASGFGWPADSHVISGNGYGPGHLGLDIQANEGDPVYAAGSGVVTMAQGGWNYGYGNVIQIDHGNGYVTVYAHLSVIYVSLCTPVARGAVIGAAGNTGNSFGTHLHFEVRLGGSNINPYDIMQ